MRRAEVLS
jgi:hypothetical protein